MPASCRRSAWRAMTGVRASSASSVSIPARAGTSSESWWTTGRGRRKWAAAGNPAGGLASGSAGAGVQPPASWL
eukprot:15445920-Alexandrium_andersonii.AAC.1